MIRIAVRLYASLRRYGPDSPVGMPFTVEMQEGASVKDLAALLRIPLMEIKLAFVNGRNQDMGAVLRAGDEVGLFPPIAGGTACHAPGGSAPSPRTDPGDRKRGLL